MNIEQWSLPRRREHMKQLRSSGVSDYQHSLIFQGRSQTFDVYTVDIGFPCYRLSNGRTRSAQKERIAIKQLTDDFFADPDSEAALNEQDQILKEMVNQAGLLKIFKKDQQTQPLILDQDGYVVNGNRRLCAMRLLLDQDDRTYSRFCHVRVILLPPCTERDIKELEGRLQVAPEGRAEYSWVDEAMLYRDLRDAMWSDDDIARLYDKRLKEIRELIAMLEDAEYYLETRGRKGQYSLVLKKEYAFRQFQKSRYRCAEDEPKKQFFSTCAYLMFDDPDTAEGRLYESIPDALKYLEEIAKNIKEEFSDRVTTSDENGDLDILGPEQVDSDFHEVVTLVQNANDEPKVREIIRDTIEDMSARERERRDSTFCIRQIQQASSKLHSALSALDDNSDLVGISDALHNIENIVGQIRTWINNAND